MRVFITGATGYIGERLALALVARNYEVVALVRSPQKAAVLTEAGVELVVGDLEATEAIEKGMQGCEVVFHLAAYARVWPEEETVFKKINVEGTRTIAEAALKNKVKRLIFTSTAGVYGPSPSATEPVTEDTVREIPYFNAYEATKAEAEAILRNYATKGLYVVILNPPRVYGPGKESESNAVNRLISLYLNGKWRFLPGDGESVGNYSFIDDIVEGHIKAISAGRNGENYLLGGENASYKEFFEILSKLTQKTYTLYQVPIGLLLFGSKLLVIRARITNAKPLITPKWIKKYLYDWSVSSHKAMRELDYTITPLEEGLRRTIDHLTND